MTYYEQCREVIRDLFALSDFEKNVLSIERKQGIHAMEKERERRNEKRKEFYKELSNCTTETQMRAVVDKAIFSV